MKSFGGLMTVVAFAFFGNACASVWGFEDLREGVGGNGTGSSVGGTSGDASVEHIGGDGAVDAKHDGGDGAIDAKREAASEAGGDGATEAACVADNTADCAGRCGQLKNRCGVVIECGGCSLGESCGGGGPNVCGSKPCTPECAGKGCGDKDGCDGVCSQGDCDPGQGCVGNACQCDTTSCGGCCRANECTAGNDDAACGQGGVTCFACQPGESCGTGSCETCGGNGEKCCAGNECQGPLTCGGGGATGKCGSSCGPLEQSGTSGTTALCVAKLVAITGGYSIDATEVTGSQYRAWLSTNPSTMQMPSECTNWKSSYNSGSGAGNYPVADVDWCDAYGYCKGVGKRLCGKIGGGANGYYDFDDATKSQWYKACGSNGENEYPYGNTYQAQRCNGYDHGVGATVAVGSMSGCESPVSGYTGVYDLSGNVAEWEDSCDGKPASTDYCRIRGGAFSYYYGGLPCDKDYSSHRSSAAGFLGFRCCAP